MKDKPLCVVALCLLCLLLPAVPLAAQGEDYMKIAMNSLGTYWLYLPSVEVRGGGNRYIVGWIRVDYSDEGAAENAVNGVKPHYCMSFCAANIRARQWQEISYIEYDKEGRNMYTHNGSFNPSKWQECPPGSMGEIIWQALMLTAGYIR